MQRLIYLVCTRTLREFSTDIIFPVTPLIRGSQLYELVWGLKLSSGRVILLYSIDDATLSDSVV